MQIIFGECINKPLQGYYVAALQGFKASWEDLQNHATGE